MDVERLAKELSPLRYQTGHRFRNEEPFWERLNEDDLRGLLKALRDRGYNVSADSPHMKTSSMYRAVWGTLEACFSSATLPAMMLGAAKRVTWKRGKFHGMTARMGPSGS